MAGFVKTIGTMLAGGAMAAAGFVGATAMPQIRAALAGDDAFASVLRQPQAPPDQANAGSAAPAYEGAAPIGRSPSFENAPQFDAASARPFASAFDRPSSEASAAPQFEADTAATPAAAPPQWGDLPRFDEPTTDDFPAAGGGPPAAAATQPPAASSPAADSPAASSSAASSSAADAFQTAREFGGGETAPADPLPTADAASAWARAVADLTQAGVDDFQILPAGEGLVRMVVWLREDAGGYVTRQLQATGPSPTAAAAAALDSVRQHRSRSDWLP